MVWPLLLVFGGGLLLRSVLALVAFPAQGFAYDMGLFHGWATTLGQAGPGAFYAAANGANYPPGYMWVLWLLSMLAHATGPVLGTSPDEALALSLKLPAIAADMVIGVLLYRYGRRWLGERTGLLAAALFLFVPVTWYDSAVWGQVDSVGAMLMLAALLLLADGWSEPATALACLAVLVKPQGAICFVVVLPVLLRRHLLRPGTGPSPAPPPWLARASGRLAGVLAQQGLIRLATSALCGALVVIVVLLPFDVARFAPPSVAGVPVIGQVAGLVGLILADAGQYSVLTANAFNAWSLVGDHPLSAVMAASGGWTPDSLVIAAGLPAVTVGGMLLAAVGLLVFGGLLARDGRLTILLAFSVLAFAFYALPTRVHERYLFPFFASAALLAAISLKRSAAYLGLGVLNVINLHAVLAVPSALVGRGGGGGGAIPRGVGPGRTFGGETGTPVGGGTGPPGGGSGGFGSGFIHGVSLPLGDLARSELVIVVVAVGQTVALLLLVAAWIVVLLRPPEPASIDRTLH